LIDNVTIFPLELNTMPGLYAEHQPFHAFAMAAMVSLTPENLALNLGHAAQEAAYFQQALTFAQFWNDSSQTECDVWCKC
jgi:hypothetical protein